MSQKDQKKTLSEKHTYQEDTCSAADGGRCERTEDPPSKSLVSLLKFC